MRAMTLAVTGLSFAIIACSSGGTSVQPIERTPVASVAISLPATLLVGQTQRGTATPLDESGAPLSNRTITWRTSAAQIATVDNTGLIAAVAPGNAMITAASEGVSNQANVTVVEPSPEPVSTVSVSLASGSLNPGQTTQATAIPRDANNNVLGGRTITWSSSNTGIATVNSSGLVTAVAVGSAQIIATSEGKSGNATLTVAAPSPVPVASVSVSLAANTRTPGQTTQATATTRDANNNVLTGRTITWSSSNTGVATVSSSGLVTAVAVGTAQIIASCEGQSGSSTLTVNDAAPVPVASVSVSLASNSLTPGLTTQATATTRDANNNVLTGRAIAWSSSNTALATVSSSGLVTAVAVGSVQITATSESKSGSATLTVTSPPPPSPGNPNEPAGMTQITAREFNGFEDVNHWQDEDPCLFVDDPTAPSPTKIYRAEYKTGFAAGSGPCNSWLFMPGNQHTVYLSYWFRYSANWYGQSTGTNKQLYVWTNGVKPSMYIFARGDGNGELEPYATVQGSRVPRSDELLLGPNLVPSARIIRGQWQHMELVLVGNTPGTANGSLDLYLDGVHVSSYKNMQFIDGDALWGDMNFDPVWGGLGGSVPATQTFDIDHFYMSGKQ